LRAKTNCPSEIIHLVSECKHAPTTTIRLNLGASFIVGQSGETAIKVCAEGPTILKLFGGRQMIEEIDTGFLIPNNFEYEIIGEFIPTVVANEEARREFENYLMIKKEDIDFVRQRDTCKDYKKDKLV
jgi:hypothetical protein